VDIESKRHRNRRTVGLGRRRWRVIAAGAAVAIVASVLAVSGVASAAPEVTVPTPTPTVSLPPVGTHGFPFLSEVIDLDRFGYVEDEVFIEGTARSYVPDAPLDNVTDGRWDSSPTGPTAGYKTRLLIRRPTNPAKFNGTVLVDWMNVSSGWDTDVFTGASSEILREGYAYVGVSAQAVGVNFLRNTWETGPGARYASLVHPGDSYSYDMFSQAVQAIVAPSPAGPAPLGDLTSRVSSLVGYGASQSGSRLVTYVNAVHPTAGLLDGFLIFLTNSGAALSQAPLDPVPVPNTPAARRIRTDSNDPVVYAQSETEFVASARGIHAQPDGGRFRLWEYPGSAHATRPGVEASEPKRAKSGLPIGPVPCDDPPINDLEFSISVKAGLHAIRQWIEDGLAPNHAPRADLDIPADPSIPATVVRDPATGIATGGIRLPDVEVPTRTLSAARPPNPVCTLFGAVDPWNGDSDAWDGTVRDPSPTPEPSLVELYGKESKYVKAVKQAADALVADGFLRPKDAQEIIDRAKTVAIPD
jgi:Alpha/beta hydrolase domain